MKKNRKYNASVRAFTPRLLPLLIASAISPMTAIAAPDANELPNGGQIVHGQGAISQAGNVMNVQQNTQNMITNWNSFNVGSQATVNFHQPGASSTVLNRVTSGDPSQIHGQINANGNVIIANPAGVMFGQSARVDVGGLMAAGQDIADQDFVEGNLQLDKMSAGGQVINQGQIHTRSGGFVILAADQVSNSGRIEAPEGTVALLAGEQARVELTAGGLIGIRVDGETATAAIQNTGVLVSDGGKVLIQSRQATGALAAAVNQTGIIRANSVAENEGRIIIDGGQGDVLLAGRVEATGLEPDLSGGYISATGDRVLVSGELDASGANAGGEVYLGGGWQGQDAAIAEARQVHIEMGARVTADATVEGDGGQIALWSSEVTTHAGVISARGAGDGQGGAVETSSRGALGVTGEVDVSATTGQGGLWLLDPENITVVTPGGVNWDGAGAGNVSVSNTSIQNTLNTGGNVILQADDSITIAANISKTSGGDARLTFDAGGNITLNTGIDISATTGRLHLDFGTTLPSTGTAFINGRLATNGGTVTFWKDAQMGASNPVSTQITGIVGGTGPYTSGDIIFKQDLLLAASDANVTLGAQGQSDGGFTGLGGDIRIEGDIYSVEAANQLLRPQSLTLDTRGTSAGAIVLGSDASNFVGGNGQSALRQLSFLGPQTITLNAGLINLLSPSGAVITAGSTLGTPELQLNAAHTIININGGTVSGVTGYTDYVQDTFDIRGMSTAESLVINSDRSIKILNQQIAADRAEGMDVILNPFVAADALGGAVIMLEAAILTNGGNIFLGGASNLTNAGVVNNADVDQFAAGFAGDSDSRTDGVFLQNVQLDSRGTDTDGLINISGRAPLAQSAGAGVRIAGAATRIESGRNDIQVIGRVTTQTNAGNKDGVIIGEGSAARSLLATSSGNLIVEGDASAVVNPSGGTRYNGLMLSSGVLLRTETGDIQLTGRGGGGNQNFIQENHGIRMEDLNTSVISESGNILLLGASGGKTSDQGENSYGIYAAGNAMYIGRDQNRSTAAGDIVFVGDSMQFVNTSDQRLQVSSSGHLVIRPEHDDTNIHLGNAGTRPELNGVSTLYLGENWFNGSALGVFLPGPVITASNVSTNVQQLSIQGNAGGAFTLVIGEQETAAITYTTNLTDLRDQIQAAIQGITGHEGATVSISGSNLRINFTAAPASLVVAGGDTRGFEAITLGRSDLTGQIQVNAPTTFRDDVTFLSGTHGSDYQANMVINSALTVQRQPNSTQHGLLTLVANALDKRALVAKGLITANQLNLLGAGQFIATASNQIAGFSAEVEGDVTLRNNQSLQITENESLWLDAIDYAGNPVLTTPTAQTTTGITLTGGRQLEVLLDTGDLRQSENVFVESGKVSLVTGGGRIIQENNAIIRAANLWLSATTGISALHSDNEIDALAGNFTGSAGLEFSNAQTLSIDGVSIDQYRADTASTSLEGQVNTTESDRNGLRGATGASGGTLAVVVRQGDLLQGATEGSSQLRAQRAVLLADQGSLLLQNQTNQISILTAKVNADNEDITVFNAQAMTLGSVTGLSEALITGGTQVGAQAAEGGNITLATVNGTLTVARDVMTLGSGNIDLRAGGTASNLAIVPESGQLASISSGSGQIQLLAGQSITTQSTSDASAEVSTAGNVMLQAGSAIGSQQNRIELSGVDTLAATAGNGSIWLRSLGTDPIILGQVNALNSAQLVGGAVTDLAGLITQQGNGNITLTTQGGDIRVVSALNANGSGYVDLRTAGTGNIDINGATITSATGTLQLVAGGAIGTNTLTGTQAELATAGQVLLSSGGQIGTETQRIEIASAAQLASQSLGSQFIAHSGDDLAISQVNAVNSSSELDRSVTSLSGMNAGQGSVIDLDVDQALSLNAGISTTTTAGIVRLAAASISQLVDSGSEILTQGLQLISRVGDLRLENTHNSVTTLAARAAAGASYTNLGNLQVDTVSGVQGITAATDITLRSVEGDLTLLQALEADQAAGVITLQALQGGVQSGNAAISTDALRLVAAQSSDLSHAGNQLNRVAVQLSQTHADFELVNQSGFTLDRVITSLGHSESQGQTDGILTAGGNINLRISGSGDLQLAQQLSTGSRQQGRVSLNAADGSLLRTATAGMITANQLQLQASGDALLTQPQNALNTASTTLFRTENANQVAVLAADLGGDLMFAGLGSLEVGQVLTDGVQADNVWIRAQQDLRLTQSVVADATGLRPVILSAGNQFFNQTGQGTDAIQAQGGWLIYEQSVNGFTQRLAGLVPDFSFFSTSYELQRPGNVSLMGNGYLVGTPIADPEQYLRLPGTENNTSGNPLTEGAASQQPSPLLVSLAPVIESDPDTSYGMTLSVLPAESGFASLTTHSTGGRTLVAPVAMQVSADKPFQTLLGRILGDAELIGVSLVDGSPLPDTLQLLGKGPSLRLVGSLPLSSSPLFIRLAMQHPHSGEPQWVDILIEITAPEDDTETTII
ncbi:filamentous hemagglutinin N-terminal domain-containing protein [Nitrincola sp.]|uniref:two-partner secretion domain-containing protein n=1 Tax=Nitrincola sp. TaxID=1926584 RepID=UPI003A931C47